MKRFQVILFALVIFFSAKGQGYEIKIKINGIQDADIILGHHFNKSLLSDDTIRLNKKGIGILKGKDPLPGGMYFIYLPNTKIFDFLVDKNQEFEIIGDTADFIQKTTFTGSVDNQVFYDYQKYLGEKRDEAVALQEKKKETTDEKEKKDIDKQLKALGEDVKGYINEQINKYPNTFIATFLRATQEIEVPEPPKDEQGNIIDSAFQWKYYRHHYFDNFEPSDARLVRTPFYEDKLMKYIEKVIPQIPDTIIKEVDMLIEKSRTNKELFRFVLVTLFNHYAQSQIMGMDAVYVHIAEKYYVPEADWNEEDFINKVKENIQKLKPLLLGKPAPDIQMLFVPKEHFIAAEKDTAAKRDPHVGMFINLKNIDAKFLALYFWEADCGHCKKNAPKLHEMYHELKDVGLQVLAIHMLGGIEGKEKWVDFVNKHELYDWLNVWNPYDYEYKKKYDIMSSNILFLLDEDKKIIAKRIDPNQLKEIIEFELKKKKDK